MAGPSTGGADGVAAARRKRPRVALTQDGKKQSSLSSYTVYPAALAKSKETLAKVDRPADQNPLHYGHLHEVRARPPRNLFYALCERERDLTSLGRQVVRSSSLGRLKFSHAFDTHGPGLAIRESIAVRYDTFAWHPSSSGLGVEDFNGYYRSHGLHVPNGAEIDEQFDETTGRQRVRIVQIVCHQALVFAIDQYGVCSVFDSHRGRRTGYLNRSFDELVRTIYVDKASDSLVTVSFNKDSASSQPIVRSVTFSELRRGLVHGGCQLFMTENLSYPGFIEFDNLNDFLSYSADDSKYSVWETGTYAKRFTRDIIRPYELKITRDYVCEVSQSQGNTEIEFAFVNIQNGEYEGKIVRPLLRAKALAFLECLEGSRMLLKQEGENIRVIDVVCKDQPIELPEIPGTHRVEGKEIVPLVCSGRFLVFNGPNITVHDFQGKVVRRLRNHRLWRQVFIPQTTFFNRNQDIMVSFCDRDQAGEESAEGGVIRFTHLPSGKLICSVRPEKEETPAAERRPDHDEEVLVLRLDTLALRKVTAVFYDESRNELLTGSNPGLVNVWR